jgi:hypothetical protein
MVVCPVDWPPSILSLLNMPNDASVIVSDDAAIAIVAQPMVSAE